MMRLMLDLSNFSLTVDTDADLTRTKDVIENYDGDPVEILLKEIIYLINKGVVTNSFIDDAAVLKMPYDKSMLYKEYKKMMNYRASKSEKFLIG